MGNVAMADRGGYRKKQSRFIHTHVDQLYDPQLDPEDLAEFRFYVPEHLEGDGRAALETVDELEDAAGKGNNAEAHYYLGMRHYNGNGVMTDTAKAAEHWEAAATLGHALAAYQLGILYCQG